MKRILTSVVVVLSVTLSGCVYQSVSENDIRKANIVCRENSGVDSINSYAIGSVGAKCKNNKLFNISGRIIG